MCLGFGPVVDGELVPDSPLELRSRGAFTKVPTMVGITEKDGSLGSLIGEIYTHYLQGPYIKDTSK